MRRHLTPSLVVSCIALFVALGGSSYAAVKLQRNSVTSREIRNGSVRVADLAPSARVSKSNKLFRSAVTDVVLDPSTQAVVDSLANAVKGEPGTGGPAGPVGAAGPSGTATVTTREAFGPTVGPGEHTGARAGCLPGEKVVGGGARYEGSPQNIATMVFSSPDGQAWQADFITPSTAGTSGRAHVFALCV